MSLTKKEEKVKARRESLKALGTGHGVHEPKIDVLDYTASLMRALNYYNATNDNKDKRRWFMAYVGKKDAAKFDSSIPDYEFRSVGTLCRLKMRDQPLQDKDLEFIDTEIKRLSTYTKSPIVSSVKSAAIVEDKPTQVTSVQDRIVDAASTHIAEFNHMFDEFITKDVTPNFAAYLESNNVSGAVAKLIPDAFVKFWNELQDLLEGSDKQLNEGYSHIKKTKIKKICQLIVELENACAQRIVSAKAVRKPRAKKEKPASVLAAKMKYMKTFDELSLTSERPEKIVGAKEVLVYNTKYKKIQVYRAFGDATLTVKGTTIVGYDVASSGSKTMRKPEQVKDFVSMTKRTFVTAFKSLTTKESAVNGRVNEDCIILKVF